MCPPFLAYYGVVTNNESLVQEAHTQISLYRDVLRHPNGLWQHIALGTELDNGNWSTGKIQPSVLSLARCSIVMTVGNAWVAAGIVRVLATIQNSPFSGKMTSQRQDLTNWASEIFNAFYSYQVGYTPSFNFFFSAFFYRIHPPSITTLSIIVQPSSRPLVQSLWLLLFTASPSFQRSTTISPTRSVSEKRSSLQ